MDWLRTPYKFKTRVYSDPSAPLVDGFWYFTDLPFLTTPTVFGSKIYDDDKTDYGAPGEQFQPFFPFAGQQIIDGLPGDHTCGTPQQFMDGVPYPYTGPPLEYDPQWIPKCCGRLPTAFSCVGAAAAAIVFGVWNEKGNLKAGASPACLVEHVPIGETFTRSGASPAALVELLPVGATFTRSGASPASFTSGTSNEPTFTRSGASPASFTSGTSNEPTFTRSGTSPAALVNHFEPIPAVVEGGASPASFTSGTSNEPTFTRSGASPAALVELVAPIPAVVEGGASPAALLVGIETIPAVVEGGASPASLVELVEPIPAVVEGGASPAALLVGIETIPAVVEGGASPASLVELIPAEPGDTCETSLHLVLGATSGPWTVTTDTDWFVTGSAPPGMYFFKLVALSGTPVATVYIGTCGSLVPVAMLTGTECQSTTTMSGFVFHFSVTDPSESGSEYTVEIGSGPCP